MFGLLMILALDLGTKTGWATELGSGMENFKLTKFDSAVMRLTYFRGFLHQVCTDHKITMIVFEEVRYHRAIDAAHLYSAFLTVLELYAYDNGIRYKGVGVGTIKKHATGKGSAKKDAMIIAANKLYPSINVIDDNHADALCLYHYAIKTF